jgi:type II secretory pathway pseudopilin PulG
MKRHSGSRGSVLLLVVVLLAVISLLAAAAVTFSQNELGAARNEKTGDELLACADAGRQYVLSRFNVLGITPPSALTPINVDMNAATDEDCPDAGPVPAGRRCARSGHIGQAPQVNVTGIKQLQLTAGGSSGDTVDSSNGNGDPTLGGIPHKITVHCKDETGRETEVEFVVKFGI